MNHPGDWTARLIWKRWPERSTIYPQFIEGGLAYDGVRIPGWSGPVVMWSEPR